MSVSFTDSRLAPGYGDPGALDPLTMGAPSPVTKMWYDRLPAVMRDADVDDLTTSLGYPLWGYLDAMASVLDEPLRIAADIAAGGLTNPSTAPDEWVPWMSQITGAGGGSLAEQRVRLSNLFTAPPPGSVHYLRTLTQSYLTGTKSAPITLEPPWGIHIHVRAEEAIVAGGTAGLTALLYATGLVPAGFALSVTTDQARWADIQGAMPTWAAGNGKTWSRVLGLGLTGVGYGAGSVRWTGTGAGHN